jgi:hypothetical protein
MTMTFTMRVPLPRRRHLLATVCLTALLPGICLAQEYQPIMDNSFLIEEAYNQEPGVVQHVTTFVHTSDLDGWLATFTQEWPWRSQRHQLSFTVPVLHDGAESGIGDIAIHYRRQLREIRPQLAMAPRVSLILPTGSRSLDRGKGSPGVEVALPVSYILNSRFFAHTNGGLTFTPAAKALDGTTDAIMETFIGQSIVFLAHRNLNLLAEVSWDVEESVVTTGVVDRSESFFFSPGVRGAINLSSGMQIVPGIAVPIGLGPSSGDRAVFFYLSVEHAFGR